MKGIHSNQPNRIILVNCTNNATELQFKYCELNVQIFAQ